MMTANLHAPNATTAVRANQHLICVWTKVTKNVGKGLMVTALTLFGGKAQSCLSTLEKIQRSRGQSGLNHLTWTALC